MLASVLSFTFDQAAVVSDYCHEHSESKYLQCFLVLYLVQSLLMSNGGPALPQHIKELWEWTAKTFEDADKMSSLLQGQWMIWMAEWISPKRGTLF